MSKQRSKHEDLVSPIDEYVDSINKVSKRFGEEEAIKVVNADLFNTVVCVFSYFASIGVDPKEIFKIIDYQVTSATNMMKETIEELGEQE